MRYGHFDDANREYVVTRPDTPRPWSNYIGSADYGGVITNNAAGYAFYRSAFQGRLTRFQFNCKPAELPGRYVYVRDNETGEFWSNSWMPVGKPLERFQSRCRHGTGYTIIESNYIGVESRVTCLARPGDLFEIWRIDITNTGNGRRKLSVFPYVEPQCNWSAEDDNQNLQYNQYIVTTRHQDGILDIGSNINMPADEGNFTNKDQARHTFLALSGAIATGYDSDRAQFFGPYGSYACPRAVASGRCTNSTTEGDMPCGAFQVDLSLDPGESASFAVVFGVGDMDAARAARASVDTIGKLDDAIQSVREYWQSRLTAFQASTPDAAFDSMVNMWSAYNMLMTYYLSRIASLVYAGERDGLGYRDSLQDLAGSCSLVPEETRARLELLLTGQFANGGCKPVVQPFNHQPGAENEPDHFRSDDGMWLFCAVPEYVRETGDVGFFSKLLPFADKGEATVLGHLRRAIEFNLERSGKHGLPCGLHADWNDCLRLGEEGESVLVALQLRYAIREYSRIADLLDYGEEMDWASQKLRILDARIEQHAWDGEWYLRAYRFDGQKFGSRDCAEGKIFMNPQTWAILSGHAGTGRGLQLIGALDQHLDTEFGMKICDPPYVATDPEVCLSRLFNPGMKENGGIFNHTQGWGIMAAAKLGLGDRAYASLKKVLPSSYNDRAELREVEPYVVCQSTHSEYSPRFGSGRVSWLSGSAVWNYVAMTRSILGIQADYDGLVIDPCIPSDWPGFTAKRRFRGAQYHIEVQNPEGICKGHVSLVVDGREIQGNRIPPAPAGAVVGVAAVMTSAVPAYQRT